MKRIWSLLLAAAAIAALVLPTPATAGGGKTLYLKDCRETMASALVPREQAQALVPKGFQAIGGPVPDHQDEMLIVFVETNSCGDPESPSLETFTFYVQVVPPKSVENKAGGDYFIFEAGAEGPLAKRMVKHTCTKGVMQKAEIGGSQTITPAVEVAASEGAIQIRSGKVALDAQVRGAGTSGTSGGGQTRWFYAGGSKPKYFDRYTSTTYFNFGPSAITFQEEYEGLKPAEAYVGSITTFDMVAYERPRGCSA